MTLNSQQYDASQITVLEGLEPVRQRPWMYIGSTDIRGLHHLVTEIVDNWIDEALAGFCKAITIIVHADWYVTVMDNGRWIPTDIHPKTWKSALETVFTVLHAWGKFGKSAYKISWWLHWVGASVVNALSEELIVTVHKNWHIYQQTHRRGVPQWLVEQIGDSDITGTIVKWKADKLIFETTEYVFPTLVAKYRQAAYLNPWVTFTVINEWTNEKHRFYFENGIKTWLWAMASKQTHVTPQIAIEHDSDQLGVDIAFQFVDSQNSNVLSFVNNIHTADGWTHLNWFKSGLLTIVNEHAKQLGLVDHKIGEFQPSDLTDWLYAIVSVKVPNPEFEWQTKWRLWSSYVKKEVEELVSKLVSDYFKNNEQVFKTLVDKISLSAKARMAAKLAKETVLRKSPLGTSVLPWKLTDCSSKDRKLTEMFIVEGDSAGGSAKQWRNSVIQAILPLKGKILNTEQAMIQKILWNDEVKSLILAIGAWIKDSFDIEKVRYDKNHYHDRCRCGWCSY
jgi:DNA gyrase subunit B